MRIRIPVKMPVISEIYVDAYKIEWFGNSSEEKIITHIPPKEEGEEPVQMEVLFPVFIKFRDEEQPQAIECKTNDARKDYINYLIKHVKD